MWRNHFRSGLVFVLFWVAACMPSLDEPPPRVVVGECGDGTWRFGTFEIHHIAMGRGVSTLIIGPTGRTALVDVGEGAWDRTDGAEKVGAYVRETLGCARLDYVVISHFHVDHVGTVGHGGLWHLTQVQGFQVGRVLHRDLNRFVGTSAGTLATWRSFLASSAGQAMRPQVARSAFQALDLGEGVTTAVLAADGSGALAAGDFSGDVSPPDENDYSLALLLRFGNLDYLTAGDLSGEFARNEGYSYHDLETPLAKLAQDVDVYRVSHHGSAHSSNPTLLSQLRPRVSILQVGDENQDGHPSQDVVDRLGAISAVYLTEHGDPSTQLGSAKVVGHVVLRSRDGRNYTVAGDRFVASDPARTDVDGDGYFAEADPDDASASVLPALRGGCDEVYQTCY